MAGVKGKSGRPAGEKPFADAINLAVKRYLDHDPQGRTALQAVADALVAKAVAGDIMAIKEVADRLDGRSKQQTELTGDIDRPVRIVFRSFGDEPV